MARERARFNYRGDKRSVESVVRKSKQSGGMYDSYLLPDVQMLKLTEGETTLRVMPPSWDAKDDKVWGDGWDIGIWIHFGVGPDNASYLCSDKMGRGQCPICEARREADDDEKDQMKPSWRALAWVIDRNNEKAGPQVWSMPISVFREINLRSVDKKHNTPIPIDHPDEGYDITFSRAGTGLKTKYEAFDVDRDPTPLADDEATQEKWLDYISDHPLPDILQYYPAEHIESVLFGKASSKKVDEEDNEDEATPARERGHRRSRADDDEDEEPPRTRASTRRPPVDDNEEDVDERPTRTRARGRPAAEDEDEDEDEPTARAPARSSSRPVRESEKDPDEDEEDPPFEEDPTSRRGNARTSARPAREEEPDEEDDETFADARKKLGGLKERRRRR